MNASPQELAKQFAQLLGVPVPDLTAPVAPVASAPAVPAPKPPTAPAVTTSPAPAPTPVPAPPPTPASPIRLVDYAAKGYHLDVTVPPDKVVAAAEILDKTGYSIDTITGVDWMAEGMMEVVYDFLYFTAPWRVVVRARIPRQQPEIPTIYKVFPGANWHERETHDFFGIKFLGHPDLSPLLLPEDATYHPLKKDFAL